METWKRNLWLLWIGSFCTSASFSMVIPFLPIFLIQIGVKHHTELWSGVLFSAAFLAGAIASPIWGALSDKYGRKPMIVRAGISIFITFTLTAFVTDPYELLILRILQGLLAGYVPGAIALIGANTPEHRIGYALAMISTATATGGVVGPLLGGILARVFDNRIAFASAGIMMLLATLLTIFWVTEKTFVPSKERMSVLGTLKSAMSNRPLMAVLWLNVVVSFAIMTIEPVLPLYIVQLGGSVRNASLLAGIVFSLAGIASIVFAPMWGRLADHAGFRTVLTLGLLGGGFGSLAQIPFHSIWAFASIRFIYGAFFCAVYPALNGLIVRFTPGEFRGRAFGLNQTANQVGSMIGPSIGGALGSMFSIHSVFWVTGALLLATMGIVIALKLPEHLPEEMVPGQGV